jgi:hypothetical protein
MGVSARSNVFLIVIRSHLSYTLQNRRLTLT